MSELHEIRYQGETLTISLDMNGATTTERANTHVISGPWKTLFVDPGFNPVGPVRVLRCVSPTNPAVQHPLGNLSYPASDPIGHVLMQGDDGYLTKASMGYLLVQKILNT